jgi:hypothetical protein
MRRGDPGQQHRQLTPQPAMSVFGSNFPGSSSHEKLHPSSLPPSVVSIRGGEVEREAVSKMLFEEGYRASVGGPRALQFKVALRPRMLNLLLTGPRPEWLQVAAQL